MVVALSALAGCTGSAGATSSPGAASPGSTPNSPDGASTSPGTSGGTSAPALQQDFVSVITRLLPSVVEIRTSSSIGSGIVFDSAGDIVTNAHVVGTATKFQVFASGSTTPKSATLVGAYRPDDLAVIKVSDTANLRPASFGDSAKLADGDIVLAIGTPLGLSSSVTEGIVSAVGRTVTEPAENGSPGATLPNVIQTSAAINPGNSGGALVNLAGQVVGIPTLAAVDQQIGGSAPGIGFAISSDTVKLIASQLAKTGKVTDSGRAALGVEVSTVTGANGAPAGAGVVSVTKGGPAARAGIVSGDVITAVNGTATPDAQALAELLATLHPGQTASVAITRANGSRTTVRVALGQLPAS
jgi:S1-C subfamily serine protease